jgi:diguanylate cyclase (GGDEF)-like protein
MALESVQFIGLLSVSVAGFLFLALLIKFEWNLTLEDPDMSLAQVLWAVSIIVVTSHFVTELRPAVLLAGMALIILGSIRLNTKQQIIFTVYGSCLYLLSVYFLTQGSSLVWRSEIVVMLAFGLTLVLGPLLHRFELDSIKNLLAGKDHELGAALERIRELDVTDELTRFYNRRHGMHTLVQQKALADRGGYSFTLCLVNLDYFKHVNDRFGRTVGDSALRGFSEISRSTFRSVDSIARMGGGNFLVLLAGTSQRKGVIAAERLVSGLRDMVVSSDQPLYRITASMGITEYRNNEDIQLTLDRADRALNDAKKTGRNKLKIADAGEDTGIGSRPGY